MKSDTVIKVLKPVLSVIFVVNLLFMLLFGACRIVIYGGDFAAVDAELKNLGVAESVDMSEEDVEYAFHELLNYCAGTRKDILIYATVKGEYKQLFNEQEIIHMADCKKLFDIGFGLYYASIGTVIGLLLVLVFWKGAAERLLDGFTLASLIGIPVFFAIAGAFALLISQDFDKYFILFHEICFDNDLWKMDARKCLMVNIMPEDLFFHLAIEILIVFLIACALIIGASVAWKIIRGQKKKQLKK